MRKTEQRRLAELMARQDGIKVKSAMRRIQRAARSEKPIRPPAGISDYAARKFRAVVKKKRVEQYVKRPDIGRRGRADLSMPAADRFKFDFAESELLTLSGKFEMGSGKKKKDIRERKVNLMVTADQARRLFNSGKNFENELSKLAPYINKVMDLKGLEINGQNYKGSEVQKNT